MYGSYGAYSSRGAMLGGGGVSDGYEIGSKRQRMMESNPYFAVTGGGSSHPSGYHHQPYPFAAGGFPPASFGGFPVVRLRGLPFSCTDIDIIKFFAGLSIVDLLLVNKNGRFSGEAFVLFASPMQADMALQKDHQNMGRRYVEVFNCKKQDYYNAVASQVNYEGLFEGERGGGSGTPPPSFHPPSSQSRGVKRSIDKDQLEYTEVLKLRGLPFSVTRSDIVEFFVGFGIVEGKVHIACRPDGKTTGEAFVEFPTSGEAKKAMCKDKGMIGSRYVELFPSSAEEMRRAEMRSRR